MLEKEECRFALLFLGIRSKLASAAEVVASTAVAAEK